MRDLCETKMCANSKHIFAVANFATAATLIMLKNFVFNRNNSRHNTVYEIVCFNSDSISMFKETPCKCNVVKIAYTTRCPT